MSELALDMLRSGLERMTEEAKTMSCLAKMSEMPMQAGRLLKASEVFDAMKKDVETTQAKTYPWKNGEENRGSVSRRGPHESRPSSAAPAADALSQVNPADGGAVHKAEESDKAPLLG